MRYNIFKYIRPIIPSGIKILTGLVVLFFFYCTTAFAQLNYSSGQYYIANIDTSDTATYILQAKDNDYDYLQVINKTAGFDDWKVEAIIELAIDHDMTQYVADTFKYGVAVFVTWRDAKGDTSFFDDTLWVNYDVRQGATMQDKDMHVWQGAYQVKAIIKNLLDTNGDTISFTYSPPNIYLETSVLIDRHYDFFPKDQIIVNTQIDPNSATIDINWTSVDWASFYELEWVFVDDYEDNPQGTEIPDDQLKYTFKHKATRIRTNTNYYNIPVIFKRGYVIFRVRGVAMRKGSSYQYLYGDWSLDDNYDKDTRYGINTIDMLPQDAYKKIDLTNAHESPKSWSYKVRLNEDGRSFHNITYFDGLLKPRQQVTRQSADSAALVQEWIYDHAGREAISTLPVPVKEDALLKYYVQFNKDSASGEKYSFTHFENVDTTSICPPELINPFDTSSGAGKYYSLANPFQNLYDGIHKYVPDADGYPFIHRQYMPDNTGRLLASGMAGRTLQVGSGHQTRYYYGQPMQEELDRLFGTDAGYRSFYQKTMIIDPNGQVNIQYTDKSGRTVATALAGAPPANLLPLTIDTDTVALAATGQWINPQLINTFDTPYINSDNMINSDSVNLGFFTTFLVAGNSPYSIFYKMQGEQFTDDCLPDVCFDCVYQLDLMMKDLCKNDYLDVSDTIGDEPWLDTVQALTCFSPPAGDTLMIDTVLNVGSYTLSKQLSLDEQVMEYYFDLYLKKNTCILSIDTFINAELSLIDTLVCVIDCDDCGNNSLGLTDTTGMGSIIDEQNAINDSLCEEDCSMIGSDWCYGGYRMMLNDVSPQGQYGAYSMLAVNGVQTCFSLDRMSVYCLYNYLPRRSLLTGKFSKNNWRYPQIYLNGIWDTIYLNDKGQRDTIYLSCLGNISNCLPDVADTSVWYDTTSNRYYTFPEFLQLKDFITRFKSSWARSLVVYHPEFMYWWWCQQVYQDTVIIDTNEMNTFQFDEYLLNISRDSALALNLLDPFIKDPFFKAGATGGKTIQQKYQTPFWWESIPACSIPQWVPNIMMFDIMNQYTGVFSMWDVAYKTHFACSTSTVPSDPDSLILDDSTWTTFLTMYIGQKAEIMKRAANAFADSAYSLNICIGSDKYTIFKGWEFPACQSLASSLFYNINILDHPGFDNRNICASYNYQRYKEKIKRFATTREQMGIADTLNDNALMEMLLNQVGYQYYQLTGNCPLAQSLELLLDGLVKDDHLTDTVSLDQCNYLTPDLYDVLSPGNLQWEPVIDTSGKHLVVPAYAPLTCPVKLNIPVYEPFTWEDSIIAIQQIQTLSTIGQQTNFQVLVTFIDDSLKPNYVFVSGSICIPMDTCSFQPVCYTTGIAADLIMLMNWLNSQGQLTDSVNIQQLVPSSVKDYLGDDSLYSWQYIQSSGNCIITNLSNGNYLNIEIDPYLTSVNQDEIFVDIYSPDTTNEVGCYYNFIIKYIDTTGAAHYLDGLITSANGDTIPVKCCNMPGLCDNEIAQNDEALLMFLNELVDEKYNYLDDVGDSLLLDNMSSYTHPLTTYIQGTDPWYMVVLSNDTTGVCEAVFYDKNCLPDTSDCQADTICLLRLYQPDGDEVAFSDIEQFLIIEPLMGNANSNGITFEFLVVVEYGKSGIDTLYGESCIPLKGCLGCLEEEPEEEDDYDHFDQWCFPDFIPITLHDSLFYDPCGENIVNTAIFNAQIMFEQYIDSLKQDFYRRYKEKCLDVKEMLTMRYVLNEYQYTLYYYDQAGNLVRTVPPKGVNHFTDSIIIAAVQQERENGNVLVPVHQMISEYRYNSLNQVIEQETPDGGRSNYWYDKLGRIVASQNARQQTPNRYSYTKYDRQGRIIETGELVSSSPPDPVILNHPDFPDNWAASHHEAIRTFYDTAFAFSDGKEPFGEAGQQHLRGRVASAAYYDEYDDSNPVEYRFATHYSYDIHGNVKTLNQDMPELSPFTKGGAGGCFRMDYDYDLTSGNVKEVKYQAGKPDAFYHRYEYDADNRLKEVYTSTDRVIWNNDANYFYYLHGPLARVETGDLQVQGTDFAYTINGWIKGVNSNTQTASRDIGRDGDVILPNLNRWFARDAFSYSLHYYENDYKPAAGNQLQVTGSFLADGFNTVSLYNGNIGGMVTAITDTLDILGMKYRYDQINRLISQQTHSGLDITNNTWASASEVDDYFTKLRYDANGNILSMQRNGTTTGANPLKMDSLAYNYYPGTNRLEHVDDSVAGNNYTSDIDDQGTGNYEYDATGNLIKDISEKIKSINWNVYGKVKAVRFAGKKPDIVFAYGPGGNRVKKVVGSAELIAIPLDSGKSKQMNKKQTQYYIRDAQGNIMATYTLNEDTFKLSEHIIYGSSRLGVVKRDKVMPKGRRTKPLPVSGELISIGIPIQFDFGKPPVKKHKRTLGRKRYELTNHLGNVHVVISDRKLPVEDTGIPGTVAYYMADIVSAVDYYPFGSQMPGRNFSTPGYRFGFNGMEKDDEIKGSGNSYDFGARVYDSRLGRWLSIDPEFKRGPQFSPYIYSFNNPILFHDETGKWPEKTHDQIL
ncbi:MAG: RHS repeat-associated core domain-containing protein, partial [Bacteroidota bacterium]